MLAYVHRLQAQKLRSTEEQIFCSSSRLVSWRLGGATPDVENFMQLQNDKGKLVRYKSRTKDQKKKRKNQNINTFVCTSQLIIELNKGEKTRKTVKQQQQKKNAVVRVCGEIHLFRLICCRERCRERAAMPPSPSFFLSFSCGRYCCPCAGISQPSNHLSLLFLCYYCCYCISSPKRRSSAVAMLERDHGLAVPSPELSSASVVSHVQLSLSMYPFSQLEHMLSVLVMQFTQWSSVHAPWAGTTQATMTSTTAQGSNMTYEGPARILRLAEGRVV